MKPFNFLSSAAVAVCMLLASCNSGSDTKDTTITTDSGSATAAMPAAPEKPIMTMLIKHKVANFDKWLAAYEADDSARVTHGLHNFVVSRGLQDPNMVMIALHMDDTVQAKEFAMSPDLKTTMQKAGVTGAPTVTYTQTVWRDTATNTVTDRIIMFHRVKDWDTFKKVFDSNKQVRMDAGISDRAVGHVVGDPTMVSIVLAVNDMKKAEAFMGSPALKEKMAAAGVVGAPDIFFYHAVKQW